MALFEADRHEPLGDRAWDEARARSAIAAIVQDAEDSIGAGCTWRWHPRDAGAQSEPEHKSIYLGTAGVLWALWHLERQGAARLRIDAADLIERASTEYLAHPDTLAVVPSYFLGEVGIRLVEWRITGSKGAAGRLADAIERNIHNSTNEALWGAPGTMLGALHMLEWTGDARWEALFHANAEAIWALWLPSRNADGDLWTQDLYGEIVELIGAGHGFAGNVYPLLRGAALLSPERREALYERCARTVCNTAMVEGDCANWPPSVGAPRTGRTKMLMQWCHGAPGMITGLAPFPVGRSAELDALLLKAGEATWAAGPLAKGHGLCHGTAGNGCAFLELHRRTGDAIWLERARAFAMHAIGQADRMRHEFGRGRHTLWTGEPGLAVYLWHCIEGSSGMPSLAIL
jgi:hypothetical protein